MRDKLLYFFIGFSVVLLINSILYMTMAKDLVKKVGMLEREVYRLNSQCEDYSFSKLKKQTKLLTK